MLGDLQIAVDGAVFDLQGILILRTAVAGDLHGAIDNGLTGDGHANIAVIAKAAVHVEGHAVLLSNNGSILDEHIAAVVGHGVSLVFGQICAVQHHVLQRQVAVVLNQHLHIFCPFGRLDGAVLQRHIVVCVTLARPLQMEALGCGAGGADRRVFHRVGKAAEVNGEALGSDLALIRETECADSAAGGALQQSHCAAFFYSLHSRFQRFKSCAVVDFGHFFCRKHGRGQQRQCQNQRHQNAD